MYSPYIDDGELVLRNEFVDNKPTVQSEKHYTSNMAEYDPLAYYEGDDKKKLKSYEKDLSNFIHNLESQQKTTISRSEEAKKKIDSIIEEQKNKGLPFVMGKIGGNKLKKHKTSKRKSKKSPTKKSENYNKKTTKKSKRSSRRN